MTSSAPRDIVIFSTADWHTRYWTNKQHAANTLAACGHRVLFIETIGIRQPRLRSGGDMARMWTRLRGGLRSLLKGPKRARQSLWVMSPLAFPWARGLRLVRGLNLRLLRWSLKRFLKAEKFHLPDVWTYHPFVLDVIEGIKHGALSYHCVDDIAAVPGVDAVAFEAAEKRILTAADAVFVTARELETRARRFSANVHFFPNVVDAAHFGKAFAAGPEPPDLATIPRPRLGFHGVLSDYKLDVALLRRVAEDHPGWHFVLVGDERDGQRGDTFGALKELANVHFLGGKEYADLPAYLRGFDVGLLPMLRNRYTASMYPMKYHEYVASGVPVVSTDLPFTRDAGGHIEIANDAGSFSAAIAAQLARGRLSPSEAIAAVGENTWDRRHQKMLEITTRRADPTGGRA
jgi:glycosyltransferase involved in cell wall biosynthesis